MRFEKKSNVQPIQGAGGVCVTDPTHPSMACTGYLEKKRGAHNEKGGFGKARTGESAPSPSLLFLFLLVTNHGVYCLTHNKHLNAYWRDLPMGVWFASSAKSVRQPAGGKNAAGRG